MTHPSISSRGLARGQFLLIVLILALAGVAAFFILRSDRPGAEGGEKAPAAAEADGHDEHGEHGGHDDRADAQKPGATPAPAGDEHAGDRLIPFTPAQLASSGIAVEADGPAAVAATVRLPGEIRFNDDRTAHVVPRVAGVVQGVFADLGQQVRKGQVLAVLSSVGVSEQRSELLSAQKRLALARTTAERERRLFEERISAQQDWLQADQAQREAEIAVANASQKLQAIGASPGAGTGGLSRYELRAPFDGMVVEKHLSMGESVKDDANVFTISDLSSVWAQINVSATNLNLVRVGETALIRADGFEQSASGRVSYVGSLIGEQTRTATARVTLANPALAWRPGLFVTVELVSGTSQAPVAVPADALQSLDGKPTVFVEVDGGFEARTVKTGRADGQRVEIVEGLEPGTRLAGKGSFAVKAQQGKGAGGHEH